MEFEYIYLDVLWVDNLIMNFIILWITSRVVKIEASTWRLWLAAALGATYAVFLSIPQFAMLYRFMIKVVLSLCMLLVAYRFPSFKECFKILATFYAVTFIFGGAALGLYYLSKDTVDITGGVFYIKDYSVKILFISTVLVVILFRTFWNVIRNRQIRSKLFYKVKIIFDEKSVVIRALLDTGNALCDPISRTPVIVVEYQQIKSILPLEIRFIFTNHREYDLEVVSRMVAKSSWIERFRMIPFTALGKTNGMLIGFKPDRVLILMNESWCVVKNVIVGIYNQRLSKDEQYEALIHPEIIS